ncbi:MAG: PD40 domain-containing protein [Rhodothermales bacterium]|nr:PD40 domain-containing protein [Rhodothermales bacterium]MBO6778087.1 PD40 domain-containing protein [Rhodothermales bacterium]
MKQIASALFLALACGPVVAQTVAENDSSAALAKQEKALPLIPTRTMAYTATEGSWISLDVSPDGETILFELLGDLYTMPVTGGEATRITSGMAYDMQPRYSPDGQHIVFISDRNGSENIWVANADGSEPRARTTAEKKSFMSPEWTPDGTYIVANDGTRLRLYHRDGGSGAELSDSFLIGAAFGPDADVVWVNIRGTLPRGIDVPDDAGSAGAAFRDAHAHPVPPQSSSRRVGTYQIAELDRSNGEIRVRSHEHEGAFRPVPSPDGRYVVYATRHDARSALKLLDLENGNESWLVMDVQRDDSQGGGARDRDVYPGSAFLPDGSALITSFGGKIWRVSVPGGALTEIPFSAEVELEMGPLALYDYPVNDSTLTVSQIRGARPSPDGSRLVFSALDRLWVAPLSQDSMAVVRDARRLTDHELVEHGPVWSPDGRWIAYVTWDDARGGHIRRVRADGTAQPETLTPAAFYDKIAYSRDGTRIMGMRGSRMHRTRMLEDFGSHHASSESEYVWIPAEGGEVNRIKWVGGASTQEGRNAPHIGPDPERLYIWDGSDGLLSMRFDGTELRTVVKVSGTPNGRSGGSPVSPDEVVLSPDGKRALVRVARNVYAITVPPIGGNVPTVSVRSSSAFPSWRITDIGGDFVGWANDGSAVHYAIGRSFFRYDLSDRLDVETAQEAAKDDSTLTAPADYSPLRTDIEIVVPKDRPSGDVVLRGARVITMNGDQVLERGDIWVRDNRIAGIGPALAVPDGTREIPVTGKTIIPGLVDIHAHTWVAWGVHRRQVSQFLAQLAYGVTTQRDPQTSSEDVVTYSDLVETGDILGPRIYSTGPGIFSSDAISSLEEARNVLKRYADHFNTLTIKQYLAGDRKVRQWVIMAANELGLTPTTEGGSNFTMNLTLMQDGYAGLEHALPISPFYEDVVRLTAESGLFYTPTLVVAYGGPSGFNYYITREDVDANERLRRFTPHDELDKWKSATWYRDDQYVHFLHAEQLTKVVEAGGKVGLGSHGEVQGLGTHWELWMMASGGMQPMDALRAATIHSADAIGLDNDLGSLEAGKLADLIVLDSNPLDDIHNTADIRYVMKNGRLYDAATMDEIWPRNQPLPDQWWWRVEPER